MAQLRATDLIAPFDAASITDAPAHTIEGLRHRPQLRTRRCEVAPPAGPLPAPGEHADEMLAWTGYAKPVTEAQRVGGLV
ncbi:MAG: hypothetical protein NT123_14255 [Proteobacteria bacterium]|nr:hypothetical protein [Pseudomonadota bacterium]